MTMLPYNGIEQGPNFDRARSQIATPFQYLDLALDAAVSNAIFNVSGDFLYVDASSTGAATLELNNQYADPAAPFYIQSGFAINAIFKQIKLSWNSQPGQKIRLMYSTGERVIPATTGLQQVSVLGTVTTTGKYQDAGNPAATFYNDNTPLPSATARQVFAPGQNVNGAIIYEASMGASASGAIIPALIAATAPPTTLGTGIIILNGFGQGYSARRDKPVSIPSAYGLYWFSGRAAEDTSNGVHHYVAYSLL